MSRQGTVVSTVWLEILRAGRPVKYADVAKALPELPHSNRSMALNIGHRLGYLTRAGSSGSYEYNITPACTVPPGVPLVEVLEATS